jgi:hypothetical protein
MQSVRSGRLFAVRERRRVVIWSLSRERQPITAKPRSARLSSRPCLPAIPWLCAHVIHGRRDRKETRYECEERPRSRSPALLRRGGRRDRRCRAWHAAESAVRRNRSDARDQAWLRCVVRAAESGRGRRFNVGCAETGPADGAPVILLHGWPYDIHSYAEVAALLASAGFRMIVPYLRGSAAGALVRNSARWLSAAKDQPPIASLADVMNVGLIAFAGRARRGRGSQRPASPTLKARGRRPGRPR